jgi:hypothetical protein
MICKTCGKHFHCCTSCYAGYPQDEGYCSEECAQQGTEFKECKKLLQQFTKSQLKDIDTLCHEYSDDFVYRVIEHLQKEQNE